MFDLGIRIAAARPDEMCLVRALFLEYAAWAKAEVCFKDFQAELDGLPGAYAHPRGGIWLAWPDIGEEVAGIIALHPLSIATVGIGNEGDTGELKRLWVRPGFRGCGLGRLLVEEALRGARQIGYRRVSLETLERMTAARALYRSLGFNETRKLPGSDPVVAMELEFEAVAAK